MRSKTLIFFCSIVSFLYLVPGIHSEIIVSTKNGHKYLGEKREHYYAFEGVRYAAPPTGPLRFEPPQPFKSSNSDVINATSKKPPCMQMNHKIIGDEDCLFLNIYTKDVGNQVRNI